MLYMVIERYKQGAAPVYERAAAGRLLPPGLTYVASWVVDEAELSRCFQLMATDDPASLTQWIERWSDLVDFEVVPVISSAEAVVRTRAGTSTSEGSV